MGGNGTEVHNGTLDRIVLETTSLTFLEVKEEDSGLYNCSVRNDFGMEVGETSLLVYKNQNAVQVEISHFYNPSNHTLCHNTTHLTFQVFQPM